MMDKQTTVSFECDRKQCKVCTSECRHTTNVHHAKNFKQVYPGYYEEITYETLAQDKNERIARRLLNAWRKRRKRT